jgi:hypothetical protein
MAAELPYAQSTKNIQTLFEKIKSAKVPDALTHTVLYNTFGLKSVNDRSLISILKKLGFLDSSGKPTNKYLLLKNEKEAPSVLAAGIIEAYEPLISANEKAYELNGSELKGLIAQVTGADESVVQKINATFSALVKLADFKNTKLTARESSEDGDDFEADESEEGEEEFAGQSEGKGLRKRFGMSSVKGGFHFNIQIHLPSNSTEETYINIFSALRKVF